MKKYITISLFILLFAISAHGAHAQTCQWIKQSNGNVDDLTISSVSDASGNLYVVSSFNGAKIAFGSTTLINPAMVAGVPSSFIVKYNAAGTVLWAKLIGGGQDDLAYSVTMDAAGNLYVYGNFFDATISFGATTLTNVSDYDNFLVKLDTAGNPIWARAEHQSASTSGFDFAIGVVADDNDHIFVTGSYDSSITIGSIYLASPGGNGGAYVAKYDTAGNIEWATTTSGSGYVDVNTIAVDSSDNVYIAGDYTGPTLAFSDSTITNVAGEDLFVAKYSTLGVASWARDIPDSCFSSITDIDADAGGNLYLAGLFYCPNIIFGTDTLVNQAYSAGSSNALIVKYNTSGSVDWAHSAGGASGDAAVSVDLSPLGYLVVGGEATSSPAMFDTATLSETGLFLACYSTSGDVRWLKSADAPSQGIISSLSYDGAGNIYGSGYFNNAVVVDSHTITDTSTTGNAEIFTASFTLPASAVPLVTHHGEIALYPNPATTLLTITSSYWPITDIVITDMLGRELYHSNAGVNTMQQQISVAAYSSGVYFARINGTDVYKFVKQ